MSYASRFALLCIGIVACGGDNKKDTPSDSASMRMATASASPDARLLADSTGPVSMNISATIGGNTYPIMASGECGYEPNAAIFDNPAEIWIARAGRGSGPYLNLSVWKLKRRKAGVRP